MTAIYTPPRGVNASTILRAAEHCINVRRESRITASRRESRITALHRESRITALRRESRITALRRESRITALRRESRITALRRESRITALRRESRITASRRESSVYIRADSAGPQVHWITEMQSKCFAITTDNWLLCRIYGPNADFTLKSLWERKGLSSITACVYSCKAWRWFVWKVGRNERLEHDRS